MEKKKILVLLQDLESDSVEDLDIKYESLVKEKEKVTASDLQGLFESLSGYGLDLDSVIKTLESKQGAE